MFCHLTIGIGCHSMQTNLSSLRFLANKTFSNLTLVDEDTEKPFKKPFHRIPAKNIRWNWDFKFSHPLHDTYFGWKNLNSTLHWIIWAEILLNCRHIIFMCCAFSRNWVPAFKLNHSKLVPLLPGTNLGPVCVGDTQKRGKGYIK